MTKDAHKRLQVKETIPEVLVLGDPLWRPSLAGLLANKLAEEYRRPAFVWGRDGRGLLKGSCRSDGTVSVVTLMNAVPHLFHEFGGHHMSGGFGVHEDHIHTFGETLCDTLRKLGSSASCTEENVVDVELALDDVNEQTLQELASLAPYGVGNPKPLFVFHGVIPKSVEVFGKAGEHTKLTFDTKGKAKEAIAFFTLPEAFSKLPIAGEPVALYGHIEQSFFMGRLQTRIRIVDICS
jgi:single-stranded-DNA-specific exonuclease